MHDACRTARSVAERLPGFIELQSLLILCTKILLCDYLQGCCLCRDRLLKITVFRECCSERVQGPMLFVVGQLARLRSISDSSLAVSCAFFGTRGKEPREFAQYGRILRFKADCCKVVAGSLSI